MSRFNSDKWIPDLRNLCLGFSSYMTNNQYPGSEHLKFSDEIGDFENPGKIIQEYHASANEFKTFNFGDNDNLSYIDHHKIAAIYIRAFLMYSPFYIDIPAESKKANPCKYVYFANEYFIIALLSSMFKAWDKHADGEICNKNLLMPVHYRESFIKLMYHYKGDISKIDLPSFANLIYLIEQHYFK